MMHSLSFSLSAVILLKLSCVLVSPADFSIFCVVTSLDRHVQSHHGHHKPFRCKLCPFKSAYVSRLKSHLHKAHTGKTPSG